jgi:hypothetical protein
MSTKSFEREWALNWVRGSLASYLRNRTPIGIVFGRIRRAVKSYGISIAEVEQIIDSLLLDPTIDISREVKEEKVKELLELIESLKKGEEGG